MSTTAAPGTMSVTKKVILAASVPVVAAAALAAPAAVAAPSASASAAGVSHYSNGGVTIAGKSWLQGHGVSVIRSRQCTELATRLYAQKKWGSLNNIYATHGGKAYDGGKLKFHYNNTGYVPVPGDVLVELGGPYQHVAVVNYVKGNKIYTVEQNAAANGVHVYSMSGKKAKVTGAYGPRHVGGFIHSKKNKFENPVHEAKVAKAAKKAHKH